MRTQITSRRHFPEAHAQSSAFTLIEVLVVVAIIALLTAILLPSLQSARRQARRAVCLSNMHQLAIAMHTYQADHKGRPPQWKHTPGEAATDGIALWVNGSHKTRLGILYPKYVGKNENIFYCPDARENRLMNKGDAGNPADYPWSNFGTALGWAYGSYEYRARYYHPSSGPFQWLGVRFDKGRQSIASDAFAGRWNDWGPYPAHTPIQDRPRMLYYNVAYTDGSANRVRDFIGRGSAAPFAPEFRTRAPGPVQDSRKEYTPLLPATLTDWNPPLPPQDPVARNAMLNGTGSNPQAHIDRAWTFFDTQTGSSR